MTIILPDGIYLHVLQVRTQNKTKLIFPPSAKDTLANQTIMLFFTLIDAIGLQVQSTAVN